MMRLRVNYLKGCKLNKGFVRKLLSGYIITLMLLMSFSVIFTSPGRAYDLEGTESSPTSSISGSVGGEGLPKGIPLNDPPVANSDSYGTDEDVTLNVGVPGGVLGNDVDSDGPSALTAHLDSYVGHGTLTLNPDGSFDYDPNDDWFGVDTFTYRAFDGGDYSGYATVTITVDSVNDPPIVYIQDQEITEGGTFTAINLDYYVYEVEDQNEDLVWTYDDNVILSVIIDADRIATISIPDGWYGEETITFTAEDTGGLCSSDDATFTVNEESQGHNIPQSHPGEVGGDIVVVTGPESGINYDIDHPGDVGGGYIDPVAGPEPQGGGSSSSSNQISTFYIIPDNQEIGISHIEVTPTKYFADIEAIVSNNPDKPQNIPGLTLENKDNSIKGYTTIFLIGDNKILTDEDVESMKVKFKINKAWIDENNINKDSVAIKQFRQQFIGGVLQRYTEGEWLSLTSTLIPNEDEEYFYYEVDAPGCSATFAIIGTEIVEVHPYQSPGQGIPWTAIIGIVISASVLLVIILFKAGYIYTDEEKLIKKPVEKTHKPKINKITQIIAVLLFWI